MDHHQNFVAQFQAFLQLPDLFTNHPTPPCAVLKTSASVSLLATALEDWAAHISPTLVLGKRVEYFMHYYLQQQPQLTLLTNNLQIIDNKRTIGELDFLYYNKEEQQTYHLEQVYKFYIYYPQEVQQKLDPWIGPNNKDSLVQKLDKLQHKQFPLLHHPATQELLTKQGIATNNIHPQLSYKAALFTPWQQPFPTDSPLNPACWRGYWLTHGTFIKQHWDQHLFYLPSKQDWGISPTAKTAWISYAQLLPQLDAWLDRQKAPLCWIQTPQGDFLQVFILWW